MLNLKKTLVFATASVAAIGLAYAATGSLTMSSEVVQQIAINQTTALQFGEHLPVTSSTTVPVEPTSDQAGVVEVTGTQGKPIDISLPSTATMTCSSTTCTGDSISVGTFSLGGDVTPTGTGNTGTATLPASTTQSSTTLSNVRIGATETLDANAGVGSYSGTVTITVNYAT